MNLLVKNLQILVVTLVGLCVVSVHNSVAASILTNGDFSQGLVDWNAGQYVSVNSARQAVLQGQPFESDVTLISLNRAVDLHLAGSYTLSFDVYFENVEPRSSSGQPNFFEASYWSDNSSVSLDQTFLGYDKNGPYDPNDTSLPNLPGANNGWFHFYQDISFLAGDTGILYFDLYDRGDAFISLAKIDNVDIDFVAAPVPEPSTFLLLVFGGGGLVLLRNRRKQ